MSSAAFEASVRLPHFTNISTKQLHDEHDVQYSTGQHVVVHLLKIPIASPVPLHKPEALGLVTSVYPTGFIRAARIC